MHRCSKGIKLLLDSSMRRGGSCELMRERRKLGHGRCSWREIRELHMAGNVLHRGRADLCLNDHTGLIAALAGYGSGFVKIEATTMTSPTLRIRSKTLKIRNLKS
jgi:hypothetical protein